MGRTKNRRRQTRTDCQEAAGDVERGRPIGAGSARRGALRHKQLVNSPAAVLLSDYDSGDSVLFIAPADPVSLLANGHRCLRYR